MAFHERVPGRGPHDARLVIIGEAPGKWETSLGEPFCGPAGALLKGGVVRRERVPGYLPLAGIDWQGVRFENLCEHMPPHGAAEEWDRDTWEAWIGDLRQRIDALDDPWLLVPTGNYSLYALTGKGRVPWHTRDGREARPGITDWRGSILPYHTGDGRTLKVIPTIHPAATFRNPEFAPLIRRDFERVAEELAFRELRLPQRVHRINPPIEEVEEYTNKVLALNHEADVIVPDIENPPTKTGAMPIRCVGFSYDPLYSLTIPTFLEDWHRDPKLLDRAWQCIEAIWESAIPKCPHNGFHEYYWVFEERGVRLNAWWYDTMYMHHALDPSAPHKLQFIASVFSREPFWKHEAKDPTEQRKYTSNLHTFFTYNGKDCCVPREMFDVFYDLLVNQKRPTPDGEVDGLTFYFDHYTRLFEPLHDLGRHGIRVDEDKRVARYAELRKKLEDLRAGITAEVGQDLYGKKSVSSKKLVKYLYEDLKLPKQERKRKPGVKTISADEIAVRFLMNRYPTKLGRVGQQILDYRRIDVLSKFYADKRVDADGRFRSSYGLNTEAGRLQCKQSPKGTGSNTQNQDREARDMFLPDAGTLGCQIDLSQAESRVCFAWIASLTGNTRLLEMARARADEFDVHRESAAVIFNKPKEQITYEERYFGKRTVHAAQRDMGGQTMSDQASKEGVIVTPTECATMIANCKKFMPGIEDFFRWVRRDIITEHRLYDTWGGYLDFTYDRLDIHTYQRGYSFRMQPEVGRLMNQWGYLPLVDELALRPEDGKVNAHMHDGLFMSLHPAGAYAVLSMIVTSLERPRRYGTVDLVIPCEIAVGNTWKMSKEWKRMPSRKEFEEVAYALTNEKTAPPTS